jgi:transposase
VAGVRKPPRNKPSSYGDLAEAEGVSAGASMLDARNEGDTYRRVEVITGRQRRRRWTTAEKTQMVAESFEAGTDLSDVARRHGVARGPLTAWRRQLSSAGAMQKPKQSFATVRVDAEASAPEASRASVEPDKGR